MDAHPGHSGLAALYRSALADAIEVASQAEGGWQTPLCRPWSSLNQDTSAAPVLDALRPYRRVMLLGPPGSGKTIALRFIARSLCQTPLALPVLVHLPTLEGASLVSTICEMISTYAQENCSSLEEITQSYSLVLLLDGLDELESPRRQQLFAAIDQSPAISAARIMMTCRTTSHQLSEASSYQRFSLSLFPRSTAVSMLTQLGVLTSPPAQGSLREHMIELARVPLFLSMVRQLPPVDRCEVTTVSDLFSTYVDVLLREKVLDDPLDMESARTIRRAVADLALQMATASQVAVSIDKLPREVVRTSTGLNVIQAAMTGGILVADLRRRLLFSHRMLQDFLAAEALSHNESASDGNYVSWPNLSLFSDIPIFFASIVANATPEINRLRSAGNYEVAARMVAAARRVERVAVTSLVESGLDRYIQQRQGPAKAMIEVSDFEAFQVRYVGQRARESLLGVLSNSVRPMRRAMAAFALSEIEEHRAQSCVQEAMVARVSCETDPHTLYHVLDFFLYCPLECVLEPLSDRVDGQDVILSAYELLLRLRIDNLQNDDQLCRRAEQLVAAGLQSTEFEQLHHAIDLVGYFPLPSLATQLIELLEHSEEWMLRSRAAKALGRLGRPEALPSLRKALYDTDPDVRFLALCALVELGVASSDLDDVLRTLALNDDSVIIRMHAATLIDIAHPI